MNQKQKDALGLMIESVWKPDSKLRSCAHNQECYNELKEWEEKFEREQKLKLKEELIREQKFKERELSTKEAYDDQDAGVSISSLENFKIDKTSQN